MHVAVSTVAVKTDWLALLTFVVLLVASIGGLARWVISRIDRYSSALEKRLDKIDTHLGEQDVKIATIQGRMGGPGRR